MSSLPRWNSDAHGPRRCASWRPRGTWRRCIHFSSPVLVKNGHSQPRHVAGFLTVAEVAKVLAVPPHWLYGRIYNGAIRMQRDPTTGLYLFPDKPSTITQLRQLHDGLLKGVRFSPEHQAWLWPLRGIAGRLVQAAPDTAGYFNDVALATGR